MCLLQCYILSMEKISLDRVLARLGFSFTGGVKLGGQGYEKKVIINIK